MEKVFTDPTQDPHVFQRAFEEGYTPNWDTVFSNYDAAVDFPAMIFWEDLFMAYPDAKVILTARDPEQWYESVSATIGGERPMGPEVQWPQRMLEARSMARSIVRNGILRNFHDKEAMIKQYVDHIEYVKQRVPCEQLLVLGMGEGWAPLCDFVGKPVPEDMPYPHANRGNSFGKKLFEFRDIILGQSGGEASLSERNQ